MKNKIVNKDDMAKARHAVQSLNPVLDALRNLDGQVVNDDPEALAKIAGFNAFLIDVAGKAQSILDMGQRQYESRPIDLINQAHARLNQIPNDQQRAQFELDNLADNYQLKIAELKKQGGFTDLEISKIIEDPQEDINRNKAILVDLEGEVEKIGMFLADAPRFCTGLLAGTGVQISISV